MSHRNILEKAEDAMERVAEAMSSIMAFMEPDAGGGRPEWTGKFQADIIAENLDWMGGVLDEALEAVREKWNGILENELYQRELLKCIDVFRSFSARVGAFDECFCRNLDYAVTVFDDEWISRKYLKMVATVRDRSSYLTEFAERNFGMRRFTTDSFTGAARKFRNYFVGVSDDSLRALVQDRVPLPHRAKWLGDRREATIFGKMLGISCSLMNKSFIFSGRDGMPRPLNYGSDGTDLSFNSYDITPIVESVKPKG